MLLQSDLGYQAYKIQKTDVGLPMSSNLYTPTPPAPTAPVKPETLQEKSMDDLKAEIFKELP